MIWTFFKNPMDFETLSQTLDDSKRLIGLKIARYSRVSFLLSLTVICVILPLYHKLALTHYYFKIQHNFNHHFVSKNLKWLHNSIIYHNQSAQITLCWALFTGFLTVYDTNGDLKQISKRCGRVSISLLPVVLLLSLRPSPLPNLLYLSLLPFHKWISRILILQSFVHSILYVWWFWYSESLKKLLKLANIYGIIALFLFLIIGFTSINSFRRYNFKLFYYIHYISTWLTVAFLHLHSRPGIPYYTACCVAILLYQIIHRIAHTKLTKVSIICISPSISLLEFPASALTSIPILPASHIRINVCHSNVLKRFVNFMIPLQHPFTLASLPNDDTVKLIIRNGVTLPLKTNTYYYVTGVFEPMIDFISKTTISASNIDSSQNNLPFHLNSLPLLNSPLSYRINARRVFMCVGGTAISFALPFLRILNFNGVNVRLIWVTRDYRDLQVLNHFKNNFEGLEVFISGADSIDYIEQYNSNNMDMIDNHNRNCSSLGSNFDESQTNLLLGNTNNTNYGSIIDSNDEIDFTQTYSAKKKKSKVSLLDEPALLNTAVSQRGYFRDLSIIEPPSGVLPEYFSANVTADPESLSTINNTSKPPLKIPSGIKVSFGRPVLDNSHYDWCLQKECIGPSEDNQCCHPNNEHGSHVDDLSTVWVVAAGPNSLIENTRRWSTYGGLHFYAEGFAV